MTKESARRRLAGGGDLSSRFVVGFEFHHVSQRPIYQRCAQWLIDHCDVNPTSEVVDLGCGSGIVTRALLARFADSTDFRITAIDPSSAELAIARALISDPRVTFVCGRAQETAQYVRQADAVVLCNALHQIPKDERAGVFKD